MSKSNRDDFSAKTIEILAKRVTYICSNPECGKITIGPNSDKNKATNVGVAAHIKAAAPNGKRYDSSMTPEERDNPEIMNSSRKRRISQGSGIPMHDINVYINQFEQMRKMMKGMSDMKSMFGKMGGKLGQQGASLMAMKEMRKNMRRFK